MDDPNLDPALHRQALRGLKRINWVTNSIRAVWQEIKTLSKSYSSSSPLSILDVACGSGDSLIRIGKLAKAADFDVRLTGMDISPVAIASTSLNAMKANVELATIESDALSEQPFPQHDVVFCSLFLHHLDDSQALLLLRKMRSGGKHLVLVSDLLRSWSGYLLAVAGTRLLSRSRIVHIDGPRSVEAAFTESEFQKLCGEAEMANGAVRGFWPQRFLFRWEPDNEPS